MTTSPDNMLQIRYLFQRKTGLPAVSLGIQHYSPQGGGYHEGNDLLAKAGRKDTDYSKRESARDRPGTDEASAIDIGDFKVTLPNGRVVTEIDLHRFVERNFGADDALWMREYIYSPDKKKVLRLDRMGRRKSGDNSHRTHCHVSKFRDVRDNSPVRFFERFWNEMEGKQIDVTPSEIRQIVAEVTGALGVGITSDGYFAETAPEKLKGAVSRDALAQANISAVHARLDDIEEALQRIESGRTL